MAEFNTCTKGPPIFYNSSDKTKAAHELALDGYGSDGTWPVIKKDRPKAYIGCGALPSKPKPPMWMGNRTRRIAGLKAALGEVGVGVRAE